MLQGKARAIRVMEERDGWASEDLRVGAPHPATYPSGASPNRAPARYPSRSSSISSRDVT